MTKNKEVFEYEAKLKFNTENLGEAIGKIKDGLQNMDVKLKVPKYLLSFCS